MEAKISILVIDDDVTARKLMIHHLRRNNYNLFEAAGSDEGLNFLDSENIDLVLCDVMMDKMDGFTFCSKVRGYEKYKTLPFIFVTAKNSPEDKAKALEAGGDDLISKPFDINELMLKVNTLLRRSQIYKNYGLNKQVIEPLSPKETRILLVDDDESMSKLFQYNLNKAGYNCLIAFNALDGFELAKKNIPDIIISDIMMPIIDGFTFRKMILEDQELRSIPFVFLTAKGGETDVLDGYELGIADYVVKTAGPRIFLAKVDAIVKGLRKERQKVVKEINQAADSLRAAVVPNFTPDLPGFRIKHWHQTYQGIPGGDFIDYFSLDDNNLAIILGDVMGKRWGAWYFALAYAGYIRSALRLVLQNANDYSPSAILQQVNKSVYEDAKVSEVFTTLSIIIINKDSMELKYSGAGDMPLLFSCSKEKIVKEIYSKGLLLGFAAQGKYSDINLKLNSGDLLFILTDGIVESRNSKGEQFGDIKLKELAAELKDADDPITELKNELDLFTGGHYEDDISVISIKVL